MIELRVSHPIENSKLEEIFKKHVDKIQFVKEHSTETSKMMTIIGEKQQQNSKTRITFLLSSFYDKEGEEISFGRPCSENSILDIWAGATEAVEEEMYKEIQNISTSIGGIVIRKPNDRSL